MMKLLSLILLVMLTPSLCFGLVRSFDGTDDEVDMGAVLDVTTGNVSVCLWVNTTEDASFDDLIAKKNASAASNPGYEFGQTGTTDKLVFNVSDGTEQVTSNGTTDIDGTWYFACGVYNATTETSFIYVNAVQEDTDTVANIDSLTNASEFAMGEDGAESGDANGLMAYGMQFSAVLTVVEITELMWKPESIVISTPNGFWPMFGGDSPEIDLSLNDNTGTVTGATTNAGGPPVGFGGLLPL